MFFQQRERRLFTLPGSQNPNQTDYILAAEDGEALYSQRNKRPGADCDSDHELLITKFRLKLKTVGKTTQVNQIPFDYTLEVTNRFKGLDLIECLKNYGKRFVTLYRRG